MFKPTALEMAVDRFILRHPPTIQPSQACSTPVPSQPTGSTSTGPNGRRLLQLQAPLDSATTDLLSSSLSDLIPGLSTSALASFELRGIEVSEWWIYFDDDDLSQGVVPALLVNGSFSLDAYPFNTLGLHGVVSLSVTAHPWFGSQFGAGVTLSPSSFTVSLDADYQMDLSPIDGVVIRDIGLRVSVVPIPAVPGRTVSAVFSVSGTADIDLPDQSAPLVVSADLTLLEGGSYVLFHASASNWEDAFGVTGLTIDAVDFDAQIGSGDTDMEMVATWHLTSGTAFALNGVKSGDFLAVGLQAKNLSLADVGEFFQDIFGGWDAYARSNCTRLRADLFEVRMQTNDCSPVLS